MKVFLLLYLLLLPIRSFARNRVSRRFIGSCATMGGRFPRREKGSCQDLEKKAMLAEPMCAVCQQRKKIGYKQLQRDKAPFKGICHRLHPHLKSKEEDAAETSDGQTDSNNVFGTPPPSRPSKCHGKFNRIEDRFVYHKPPKLRQVLKDLCNIEPRLTANQMDEELRRMTDPVDGGLMFCHSKRGEHVPKNSLLYKDWAGCAVCKVEKGCNCNGMPPTLQMIQNFINYETQQAKKRKKNKEI